MISAHFVNLKNTIKKLGCYTVDRTPTNKNGKIMNNLSYEGCQAHCNSKGNRYVAVHSNNICYCSDVLTSVKKVSDSYCNMVCTGNSNQKCGSWDHSTVFDLKSD